MKWSSFANLCLGCPGWSACARATQTTLLWQVVHPCIQLGIESHSSCFPVSHAWVCFVNNKHTLPQWVSGRTHLVWVTWSTHTRLALQPDSSYTHRSLSRVGVLWVRFQNWAVSLRLIYSQPQPGELIQRHRLILESAIFPCRLEDNPPYAARVESERDSRGYQGQDWERLDAPGVYRNRSRLEIGRP